MCILLVHILDFLFLFKDSLGFHFNLILPSTVWFSLPLPHTAYSATSEKDWE